ncbi:MAG: hypothetical protein ABIQ31_17680 [Ferruginibacter sp.]
MKIKILPGIICLGCMLFSLFPSYAQLTGVKTIPGDYATITSAVNALNTSGVGTGGVTFNVAGGYTETISATISLTATGTSANPITFQKTPASAGANPRITSYTAGVGTPSTAAQDGIWRLVGSDYITIDGIDLRDNTANTTNPATMEYGYALYKANSSNGCQFVTIKNCVITLNNINNASGTIPTADGSTGIAMLNAIPTAATTPLATAVTAGANSSNKFYKNTIQNCNTGIALMGYIAASPYSLADVNNDIGGVALATGNTILNYGGASGAVIPAVAIRSYEQYSVIISYNTINNNNGSGANHASILRGIYITTAPGAASTVTYNTITVNGGGTTQSVAGIENTSGSTAASNTVNISNNTITNSTYTTATTGGFYGIFNNAASPAALTITNNTISNNSSSATTTGFFYGIQNTGLASAVTISGNTITGNATATLTTGAFISIYNTAATPSLTITGNTMAGNTTTSTSGLYYAILNSGSVTTTININANNIGTSSSPVINFTAVNSGAQSLVRNTKGGAGAALSISNNNFYNVLYSVTGTGSNTYIYNAATTLSQAINNNTFNNLNINTNGGITFISNSVVVTGTGTQNVNNNSIAGTFTKSGIGGTITLFTSGASSASGSVINQTGNNFSNITVSGTTIIGGWVNTDAGASTKKIQNNIFSNWTGGTGTIVGMSINLTGTNNATTGNVISNISSGGAVTGITTGAGNDKIYLNTISTLSTTGASVVGISITGGTTKNIYSNKVYDLQSSSTTGVVYGISTPGSATAGVVTANIYNNLVGDLRTPNSGSTDAVRGISLTSVRTSSTLNVYYNTIYLNAVSTGTNFGTSGIYHAASATTTTATLNLRNNIITNLSTPNGTAFTVAFRRSSTALGNYGTTSNNNLFFAGTPGTYKLICYDGNSDQTLSTYKTRLATRDAQSVTEDLITSGKFLSTSGASATYLHLDPSKASQAESGAVNITNFTTDYDADIRQGNTGYPGTGTAPDIGADESGSLRAAALSGTYNVGTGQTFTSLTNPGGLFASINNLGLSGSIVVNITSDLAEDGSNSLYAWTESGVGGYTVTIKPDASTARLISGNVSTGLIRLTGAKNVTFDGSNGTSNSYLTFRNTSSSGTTSTAFTFTNGASLNTIKYCNAEAFANATNGVILFSTSTVAGGNSSNLITYCTINATVSGNTGSVGIYSAGTVGNENTTNTISFNNIANFRDRGLDIAATGSKTWAVNNNSFYNGTVTAAINYAASSVIHGIRILGGGAYSILNNYIGGSAALATGSNAAFASNLGNVTFYGIQVTAATGTSNIKGNVIRGITVSSVPAAASVNEFVGIETIGAGIINVGGSTAGDGNMIGSNTANGSIIINTNTTLAANTSFIRGINYTGTNVAGIVNGNQVGGFDINNAGSTAANSAPSTFQGIIINTATAPTQVNNNIIGSTGTGAASNSIGVIATSTANGTTLTGLYLSSSVVSTVQVNANIVQNMSQQVATVNSGTLTGIWIGAVAGANVTATNNVVRANSVAPATAAFYGIFNNSNPTSVTISSDTISNNISTAANTGVMYGIYTQGASPAITINNNTFSGNSTGTLTTGPFAGIFNSGTPAALNINSNTFYGNTTTSLSGSFYAIYNSGGVTSSINMNSNNIGIVGSSAITYSAANSATQYFINNTGGTAGTDLSISNNNFLGISNTVQGTGNDYLILNSFPTLSQAINGNTFTNLNINTSNSVIFISDNVALAASGTQDVNNNSIVGGFTKAAGGSVTLFTNTTASVAGSVTNNNNNNFSNITVTGATSIAGWVNTDGGNPAAKNIQNNTFSNWTAGTSAVTAISINFTGINNSVSGNFINTISGAALVTGILSAGNDSVFSNTINTLSTSGTNTAVTGINITGGTTKYIYRNKIYDLLASNSANCVANGILVSGSTVVGANIFNNTIGNLRAPSANLSTDVIRGISIVSTTPNSSVNVYFNTLYLNATSSGTNFSTTGIYHLVSATASTATLNLRNNSITNASTPNGSGTAVAFRRSGTALNNYAATSNNNLFYAGTPGTYRLIFSDGTAADQTLAAYKTRMSTRESASVTEDISGKYLSTTGSSAIYLHMSTAIATSLESGAANIAGYTDDFDGQTRAGNPGYTGSSSSPDIGADEISGIEAVPPTITYTLLANSTTRANRSLTGVTITDGSGVNTANGTKPRIYYKRSSDANAWLDNSAGSNGWKYTEATNSTSPFTFNIDYSLLNGGAAVVGGVIQYFVVAQDISTIANVGINSGAFAATPAGVALNSAAFPLSGTINSYTIPFSGNYKVGTTEVFTSLTKADGLFASLNSAGMMGNTTFTVTSDLAEDGTNGLNQWAESGTGNYTLTIRPSTASVKTISGNAVNGLIRFNGADRVTVNGSISGSGKYLSFKNTNTAGTTGTAFTFINGATNNAVKYVNAEAYANATNGVIFFASTVATGNSNNIIDNCTINATVSSNKGNVAIYSAGTTGNENSADTISNNTIAGFRDRGLDIEATGSTTWYVGGNSFYNGNITGTINYPASSALHGIRILGGSGYTILNNNIGGSDVLASGANAVYSSTLGDLSYQGILLTTNSASPVSNIKGNTVAAITVSSVPTSAGSKIFTGIEANGAGINVGGSAAGEGNQIGDADINSSVVITTTTTSATNTSLIKGINVTSTGGSVIGNQVAGFDISNVGTAPAASAFAGLYINSATAPSQVNTNVVGSATVLNSIRVLATSIATTTSLSGIVIGTAVNNAVQVNGNRIDNIANLSTTSSGSFTGIDNSSTLGNITISNDTIQNIHTGVNANSGSTIYSGITSASASTISNNLISLITLSATGTNAQIYGISISGSYASTVSGNIISNISTASNKSTANAETGTPAGSAITGILNASSAAGQVINNNRLSGLTATSTAANNVVITGVGITSTGSGSIYNNRFGMFTNTATGAAPVICHIMGTDGSFNVYNNALRLSNLTNTTGTKIYGIVHASATSWNYFHNSVRLSGSSNGTALRSAAFLLSSNSAPVLKNNIFFNIRTGTGFNYAISNLGSPPTNWPATTSDYNDFYSIDANTVAEWGSNSSRTFAQWQTLTGGDAHSINNAISFMTSAYDLEPDSITNCNFNNAGTLITTPVLINTDINNNPRSGANPDLGAYEFNYTGFTITAGSNSPVCSGDSLYLTVDPGDALVPSYSWRNPANVVISTLQNPVVTLTAGQYKVTVTDSTGCFVTDSVLSVINLRPTARITAVTSLCDSGMVNLSITLTGTGVIDGTLSNGDDFSATASTIIIPVYLTATTAFSITDLADESCTAISSDMPDTVTITVSQKGEWLGNTTNWHDPVNWCGGTLPTSAINVTIPAGTSLMPVITDTVSCKNLIISNGDTLTIAATGMLNIAGNLTNLGVYTDNGTTVFNGVSGQQNFTGVTRFNNLTVNNTSGLVLPAAITVAGNLLLTSGALTANNFNITVKGNWINNAATTALTAGTNTVTFNGLTAQFIGGTFTTTFNNLTIADTSAAVSLNTNAAIAGNLTISNGTFDLTSFTANRTATGGTLNVANNATLKIGGAGTYPANFNISNLVVASTVEYSGTNQVVADRLYGNLKLSSSVGAAVKTFPATALTIVGNLISTQGTGTSVSFTAGSNISVSGSVNIGTATTFNGSSYSLNISGNWTNSGTFNGNTGTVILNGAGITVAGPGVQNFNSLTIAGVGIIFSNNVALTGSLATTGAGSFNQSVGGSLTMSGTGSTISGSGISINDMTIGGTVTTAASFTVTGNLSVSGSLSATAGTITLSGASKTISGAGSTSFSQLYVTGSVTTATPFSISSSLTVSGSFTASAGAATFTGTASLSGTANLFNVVLNGASLKLSAGSVLGVANIFTINSGIFDVTTFAPNTVNFNGAGPQNINSISYSNLVLSNGNTKTATGPSTILKDITIGSATTFNPSAYTHSVYGNWINNGSFIAGTSTIQFVGPANDYINGATTFNILTSNTSNATTTLTLQSNVSATTVNMIKGRILTQANTLTITDTRTGNGYILGNIQRTHAFTTGVAYAFEGPDNTITFSAVSSVTSVTVSVVQGPISDFPFGGSIGRVYNIAVPAGSYTATLRLHYEDDELNGNSESSMGLWRYNGATWGSIGKTANNTGSNYVEQSGLTNITNRWTASDNPNVVQWTGTLSTDWNTAGNWTVLQGSASTPPSANDIVNLGGASFTNQPTISTTVSVKNIIFGSAKAVVLSMAGGGTLTSGDMTGNWSTTATHTINANNQSITVNGDLSLGDGTNGHVINLNIGTGTVNVLKSLSEKSGSNITFSGAGEMNIYENFNYTSGTFSAGGGTVTYTGNANQGIANIHYNNLVINKAGGVATIYDSVSIAGNLLISAGELDNLAHMAIAGDVTVTAGTTLSNQSILHVNGNWNNAGTYTGVNSSTFFEGTGTQNISATEFSNLIVNKPVGSSAILTGNISLNGDLTIYSGTLNIKTFDCNRSVQGGTLTFADSATFIVGANNSPLNFSSGSLANSSTVIADGTGPQAIFGADFGHLIFRNAGVKTLVSPITVNGNLTIESGSNFDAGSSTLTLNGNWINNGTFTPSTSTLLLSGVSNTVSGNTTFNKVTVTGSYVDLANITFNGQLHITSSGSISSGTGVFITLNEDLINNGVLYTLGTTTFTGNVLQTLSLINATTTVALIVNFNGNVSPTLYSTSPPQYGYLNINNTGGVNPSVPWTILYALTVSSGASFNCGVSTHNIYGDVTNNGTITSSGVLNFIPATAATINFGTGFTSTGRVNFGGAGAITIAGTPAALRSVTISNTNSIGVTPSSVWNMTNNLTINSGSILNAGSYNHLVGGRILNNGIINSGTSTFTLNGAVEQDIYTLSDFNNITVNKPAGAVTLSSNVTVRGVLNFVTGQIQTGNNLLSLPASGAVTGAAQNTGWVNGNLQKAVVTGTSVSRVYEVGGLNDYTPATVLFANVSVGGNLTGSTVSADHPQIDSSGINKNLDVNRYWTLTNTGINFSTANATFNWVAGDVDAGANTADFRTASFDGSAWGFTSLLSPLPTSIQATGLSSMGVFAVGEGIKNTIWTGASGTSDWYTARNWRGGIPDTTIQTLIPSPLPNGRVYPVINTGVARVDTITIQNTASLTVVNSLLRVKGAIVGSGTVDASAGTIDMFGSAPQTIAANTFANNSIANLIINNNVTLAGLDTITGTLTMGSSNHTFTTGGFLTLKSTATNTARIAPVPVDGTGTATSFITGNVTVERFIPNRRAWRLLTAPLSNTGSIYDSWQNSGVYEPGKGLFITGANPGPVTGLDASGTNVSSMKSFNPLTQGFSNILNTKTTNLSNSSGSADNVGYFVFVRGDRDPYNLNIGFTNPTTLRSAGNLQTGKQVFAGSGNYGGFAMVGNPYASPVDFSQIERSHLIKRFYAWDATLNNVGAYVVLDDLDEDGIFSRSNPSSLQDKNIQSGQAFFVQTDTAGSSNLSFYESSKSNVSSNAGFRPLGQTVSMEIILNLLAADSTSITADAAVAEFNNIFCACVNLQDAIKFTNTNETFSLVRNNTPLAIERRPIINKNDTLFLRLVQSTQRNYQFVFKSNNLSQPNLQGFLEDKYTGLATPISLDGSTTFNFTINGDALSINRDRFRVVFKEGVVLPVTYTDVKAWQQGKDIAVKWNVENQLNIRQYEVEKSTDGANFVKVNTQAVAGASGSSGVYNWLDKQAVAGDNFYRIRNVDIDGRMGYSKIVKVNMSSLAGSLAIYPNPVTGGTINLQLTNMARGKYNIRLVNALGQLVLVKEFNHAGATAVEKIMLPNKLAKGIYNLEIIDTDKRRTNMIVSVTE